MTNLIIVEGMDLSGKSTLIQAISKMYPGLMIKITNRPLNSSDKEINKNLLHMKAIEKIIKSNKNIMFILDRYHWSEMAYSYKRGYDAMNSKTINAVNVRLSLLNPLMIFCNPKTSVIKKRYKVRKEDHMLKEDIEILYKRYNEIYNNSKLNKLMLNTNESINKLLKKVHYKLTTK